ncbi:MAG TPA: transporter [Vicinamibacteria bacterium]|nr:transporter [Vicinamibacteria bacterium]
MRQGKCLVATLAVCLAARASAQDVPLSQLLLQFFSASNPIILDNPFHSAHFSSQGEAQTTLELLNRNIAAQLASFPVGSSSGGFTFTLDPAVGVLTRNAASFGPLFAERAVTAGKGKLTLGFTYQQNIFDKFEGFDLREGDVHLTLYHVDINNDGSNLQEPFEGDVIDANLRLRLETNNRVAFASYGLTDRFDIGVAVPFLSVDIDASIDTTIRDVSTIGFPIHRFSQQATTTLSGMTHTFIETGSAAGLGDIVVRGKFVAVQKDNLGLGLAADVRLPTGDEEELLGSGALQAKFFAILSGNPRNKFNPHLNAGYTYTGESDLFGELPDELNYTAGFDAAPTPKLTVFADVVGRTLIDAELLEQEALQLQYRTLTNPTVRTFDTTQLVSRTGNMTILLGSVGFKYNPAGRLLFTANALVSLTQNDGLQDKVTPVFSLDYTF